MFVPSSCQSERPANLIGLAPLGDWPEMNKLIEMFICLRIEWVYYLSRSCDGCLGDGWCPCMCSSIIRSSYTLSLWAIGLNREQLSLTFAKPIYTVHSNRENSLISIALHRDVYFTRILTVYRYRYAYMYCTYSVWNSDSYEAGAGNSQGQCQEIYCPCFHSSRPRRRRGQRRTHCVSIVLERRRAFYMCVIDYRGSG